MKRTRSFSRKSHALHRTPPPLHALPPSLLSLPRVTTRRLLPPNRTTSVLSPPNPPSTMPSAAAGDGKGKRRLGGCAGEGGGGGLRDGRGGGGGGEDGAAPVERVKLLLQNQAEMLRRGSLTRPYRGIADAFGRVLREEGVAALWRGNQANVIRYFPTQVRCSIRFLPSSSNHFFTSIDCFAPGYCSLDALLLLVLYILID